MDATLNYANLVVRQYRHRSRGRRIASGAIAGIVIGCVIFILCALFCCWFCCCRKKRAKRNAGYSHPRSSRGFLSRFRNHHPQQVHPGMQEAGYGYGPQAPPPVHR